MSLPDSGSSTLLTNQCVYSNVPIQHTAKCALLRFDTHSRLYFEVVCKLVYRFYLIVTFSNSLSLGVPVEICIFYSNTHFAKQLGLYTGVTIVD